MEDQVPKKRKFVVLSRRPDSVPLDDFSFNDDTDIYDLSAHISEVKPVVEIKLDREPVKEEVVPETPQKKPKATRTRSKTQDVVDLDAKESSPELVEISETKVGDSDDDILDLDIDPDKELELAMERARKERDNQTRIREGLSPTKKSAAPEYSPPVEETPRKKSNKPKVYRGEKVCFRLAFPVIGGHTWPSVIFTTRSLVPFHEIQEKLIMILHQRCEEDEIYPPAEHELEEFIFVLRGSRIFRNSTCQTMGISTRDPSSCPEVQWLNKEDANKFRNRMEDEEEEVVEQLGEDEDDGFEDVSVQLSEPEPEEPEEEEIELTMTGKDKKPVTVRVGMSRQFIKLAEHYAKEKNVDLASVQFYFDGDKIDLNSTVEDADVEDEDMLEVRLV
ncbi:hypothetical protein CJU90_4432 [Yarrowia sp. C11]|nr:hypothetical protein CKK34_6714 [Yarrowia sp. E02]KAG5365355.1 hypothetical protein CJU90_4432 [Yarrowia sp. C11]